MKSDTEKRADAQASSRLITGFLGDPGPQELRMEQECQWAEDLLMLREFARRYEDTL